MNKAALLTGLLLASAAHAQQGIHLNPGERLIAIERWNRWISGKWGKDA